MQWKEKVLNFGSWLACVSSLIKIEKRYSLVTIQVQIFYIYVLKEVCSLVLAMEVSREGGLPPPKKNVAVYTSKSVFENTRRLLWYHKYYSDLRRSNQILGVIKLLRLAHFFLLKKQAARETFRFFCWTICKVGHNGGLSSREPQFLPNNNPMCIRRRPKMNLNFRCRGEQDQNTKYTNPMCIRRRPKNELEFSLAR